MLLIKSNNLPLTEARLLSFEMEYGLQLPIEYKNFLLENNGGIPNKIYFVKNNADEVLNEFLSLEQGELSIIWYCNKYNFHIENKVPIAEDAFGNLILLNCNPNEDLGLFFWDYEDGRIQEIAGSFAYFLENLQSEL